MAIPPLFVIAAISFLGLLGCGKEPEKKSESTGENSTEPPSRALQPPELPPEKSPMAEKLRDTFVRSFQWDEAERGLLPKSEAASQEMSERFQDLVNWALLGPSQAESVNQRDILKYYYWSAPSLSPEERAYFFEAVRKGFSGARSAPQDGSPVQKKAARRLFGVSLGDSDPFYLDQLSNCKKAMGMIPRSPQYCDLSARVRMADLSPDPFDNVAARHKVLQEMEAYYVRFFQLRTPEERLRHHHSLLEGDIKTILFSGNFGPTWPEHEMDAWLQTVETAEGKKLEATLSSKPLRMEDLDGLKEPAEVSPAHLPAEMKALARGVIFSPEAAKQLGLAPSRNTLWDFISQNLKIIYLTPKTSDMPDSKLHGQMYSPFLRAVMVDVQNWKDRLGKMYYLGVLTVLAHEAYHIYHLRKTVTQNPKLQGAQLLDERNAYLMSATVFEQLFHKIKDLPEKVDIQKKAAVNFGLYLAYVYGSNAALEYPVHDESFRTHFSPSISQETLRKKPENYVDQYVAKNGGKSGELRTKVSSRLNFHPEDLKAND